jgi:hypothetical protein
VSNPHRIDASAAYGGLVKACAAAEPGSPSQHPSAVHTPSLATAARVLDGQWCEAPSCSRMTSNARRRRRPCVHSETLDDEPACAAFVGARVVLLGTKQGRIFRFDLER